jgi:hypothetical protein
VQRWIVAALRHRQFFRLAELNQAIRELLDKLNQRPFRKHPGCRASLFQELDRPALGPLPPDRFELQQWTTARVNIDYHLEIDRHYYSVPYVLTGQVVEVRSTLTPAPAGAQEFMVKRCSEGQTRTLGSSRGGRKSCTGVWDFGRARRGGRRSRGRYHRGEWQCSGSRVCSAVSAA